MEQDYVFIPKSSLFIDARGNKYFKKTRFHDTWVTILTYTKRENKTNFIHSEVFQNISNE